MKFLTELVTGGRGACRATGPWRRPRMIDLAVGVVLVLLAAPLRAQYVSPYVILQGTLMSSGGTVASNATLTFVPSQVMFVAGTAVVVNQSQCGTDVNGNVVGIGNPVTGPTVSAQYAGALPAGNYYVEFTWYDQLGNQTLPSPEVAQTLSATGELHVTPPAGSGPPQATGMDIYIGTSPGTETYQGQTTSTTATYTQAVALSAGAAVPTRNLTPCRLVANDAAWPTGTGYTVSLTDVSGNALFSSPEMWQFSGPGSAYNLSNGIPYYHGQVTYPVPILTVPYNHNPQSISGPLAMGQLGGAMYSIYDVLSLGVGTATPAWGVDVEGLGLAGAVNAKTGFLVNGGPGLAGECLASDGAYFDTPQICGTAGAGTATITALSGAGAGATAVCNTGHVCDSASGEVLLTLGSAPFNIGMAQVAMPFPRDSEMNCVLGSFLLGGPTAQVTFNAIADTTDLTIETQSTLTAGQTFAIDYWCGGR